MAKRKPDQKICTKQDCDQVFHTENRKQKHEEQHQYSKYIPLYNLDKEGKIDRREMIYQGIAKHQETQMHGKI